jgi:hypothetical protein
LVGISRNSSQQVEMQKGDFSRRVAEGAKRKQEGKEHGLIDLVWV